MTPVEGQPRGRAACGTPPTAARSPLLLEEWAEFNRRRWQVRPERVVLGGALTGPRLEALLYFDRSGFDRSGKIWQPPRSVYLPAVFQTAPDTGAHRTYRQWTDLSKELAGRMAEAGVRNTLTFPPEVTDMRAWQWAGFLAGIKYTFYQDFPYDLSQANQSVRSRIKKAQKAGYSCRRAGSTADVMACLNETERRSGFDQQLSPRQLEAAQRLMGGEHFRCYAAYGPSGEPASAYVALHCEGGYALAWIIATRTAHLPSGVTQLLHQYVVQDLQDAGAAGLDLVGANMESIAAAKAGWGPRLVPYYSVQQYSVRRIAVNAWEGAHALFARFREGRQRCATSPAPED
jgi:hypothetical protein